MIINRTSIPTDQLLPLIEWVMSRQPAQVLSPKPPHVLITFKHRSKGLSGLARSHAFTGGRRTRGVPGDEPVVHVKIGVGWEAHTYPHTETYKEKAGSMTYYNWQEHFIALLAHEFRHIEQYTIGENRMARKQIFNNSLEVDAERHAMKLLAEYQKRPIRKELSNAARKETKQCPRCKRAGEIAAMFGYRTIRGTMVIPQSYCHECRRTCARERRES